MIYHPKKLKAAQRNKIARWATWYYASESPQSENVISVWWEWHGSTLGQYDIFWYVGPKGFNYEEEAMGGYKSMTFGKSITKIMKAAYLLQKRLERKYPKHTPLPFACHKQTSSKNAT